MPQAPGDLLATPAPGSEAHAGPRVVGTRQPQVQQSLRSHHLPSRSVIIASCLFLSLVEALRFLLLFHEVGGELGYSVFQQLLLLGCGGGSGLKVIECRRHRVSSSMTHPDTKV